MNLCWRGCVKHLVIFSNPAGARAGVLHGYRIRGLRPQGALCDAVRAQKLHMRAHHTHISTKGWKLRAIAGGGRYDNLMQLYGSKKRVPCCGFGFGDCVIIELLKGERSGHE